MKMVLVVLFLFCFSAAYASDDQDLGLSEMFMGHLAPIGGEPAVELILKKVFTKYREATDGDAVVRVSLKLFGSDDDALSLWVTPYVKIPLGTSKIGNEMVRGGIIFPVRYTIPFDTATKLTFQTGVADLKDDNDYSPNRNNRGSYLAAVSLIRPIFGDLTGGLEFRSSYRNKKPRMSFNSSILYAVTKSFDVDLGTSTGLEKKTSKTYVYVQFVFKF